MEEAKKREVATFRFGVISDFVVAQALGRGRRNGCFWRRRSGSG